MAGTALTREQLVEIREALYSGKQVYVMDGQVRVAANASGPPMAGTALDFYNGKLADIEHRVEQGWNFTLSPDGTITGNDNKGSALRATPDPKLDAQDVDFAHSAIRGGQKVSVQPDGTIVTAPPMQHTPGYEPGKQEFEIGVQQFDKDLAAGTFDNLAKQGAVVTYEANNRVEEIPLAPATQPPVQPPADTPPQPSGTPASAAPQDDTASVPPSSDDSTDQPSGGAQDDAAPAAASPAVDGNLDRDPSAFDDDSVSSSASLDDQAAPRPAASTGAPNPSGGVGDLTAPEPAPEVTTPDLGTQTQDGSDSGGFDLQPVEPDVTNEQPPATDFGSQPDDGSSFDDGSSSEPDSSGTDEMSETADA